MKTPIPWLRVFAEGVVIVASILLAFGIDAWWEGRQERAQEQEYLAALQVDFLATKRQFERTIESYEYITVHNRDFLRTLNRPVGSVPLDSLERRFRPAFIYNRFTPVLATYNDMVNSGALDVLQSDSLRTSMARFEASLEWIRAITSYMDDHWEAEIGPFIQANFDLMKVWASVEADIGTVVLPPIDLGPPIDRIRSDEEAFYSRDFINLLVMKTANQEDVVRWARNSLRILDDVLRHIDGSMR